MSKENKKLVWLDIPGIKNLNIPEFLRDSIQKIADETGLTKIKIARALLCLGIETIAERGVQAIQPYLNIKTQNVGLEEEIKQTESKLKMLKWVQQGNETND